jgi:hypothetical protein
LDEKPRATFTPDYFKTSAGVMSGLTSMYAHLRYIYGNAYVYNACLTGTDEVTYGASGNNSNFSTNDFTGPGGPLTASNGDDAGGIWGNTFPNINTANGVIDNGTIAGVDSALLAEARFFRAFDYFLLVQTFGGVPLDLGSGELKFNTSTVRTSKRNTVPEVYTKVIFPDFIKALNALPEKSRLTGTVTKTVARLFLSKAYLTYGWWLENPNNIPTYPVSDRTDPNGHDAAWYYAQAYNLAIDGITKAGSNYGLQPTFYDVNVGSNDRNNECLLYADHTQSNELYNGASLTYGSGGNADNFAVWMLTWNYTSMTSATATDWKTKVNSVQREAAQWGGRPWVRMAPTSGVFSNTFAEKTNDSRYDGTFATVYRGNWPKAGNVPNATLFNANNMVIAPGDPVLTFLDSDPGGIDYTNSKYQSSIGVGVLPGRADYVIAPNAYSRIVYPGLWKLGCYRTDNGAGLGQPNASSTRPFVIAKFSEFFFLAAEAALKGAPTKSFTYNGATNSGSPYDLINVIRARAGKWKWNNAANAAKVQDNSAAMVAATPAIIDLNYVLMERSREYYGEGYRWFDLVRTQKWIELSTTYTICDENGITTTHTPKLFTRTILPTHYLRPIPQNQFDNMDETAAEKAAYQNPGY